MSRPNHKMYPGSVRCKSSPPPRTVTRFRVSWRRAGWCAGTSAHYRVLNREDLALRFAERLRERETEVGGRVSWVVIERQVLSVVEPWRELRGGAR